VKGAEAHHRLAGGVSGDLLHAVAPLVERPHPVAHRMQISIGLAANPGAGYICHTAI
jgi:hypothetical protein